MLRRNSRGAFGGMWVFPGGQVDPDDAAGDEISTARRAAVREAHEEVALPPDGVRVLGTLTPLDIPVSGFRLHPVVAARDAHPLLVPSDGEVARILDVAVDELRDPSRVTWARQVRDGRAIDVPAFHVGTDEIWGATAMVLAEFLSLLGWRGPSAD